MSAATQPVAAARMPGIVGLGWGQIVIELKQFWRSPTRLVFTFMLPLVFLMVFTAIFGNQKLQGPPGAPELKFRDYFVPGIIAVGIMSTTFSNLATSIPIERGLGLMKRLSGTPLPREAFFIGKIGMTVIVTAAETIVLLAVGVALYHVKLPTDAGHWVVLGWVFLLGTASCSVLGIAYTRLIKTADSAIAIVQMPYLILQFISGVFFQYSEIPKWMQDIAMVFPLKWLAQGMRYAFVPDWLGQSEYGGWQLPMIALMLTGWTIAGFVLSVLFFRWNVDAES
jgi:ABC-2 type transport system permease protein